MLSQLTDSMKPRVVNEEAAQPHEVQASQDSLAGSLPDSYLTEPMHLRLGNHEETIRFMVATKMADAMILGLSWLSKWNPAVHWGERYEVHGDRGDEPFPPP